MKTPITSIKRLVLALCLATPVVSWATPTATVVWRSNLGQSYSIYAVTQRDAALSEGKLTVSSTWGEKAPYFDMEGLGAGTVSVLVKYSGLDISQVYESDSDSVGVAFASVIDSDNNVVGACVQKADSANTVRAYHCGASATSATPKDIGSMTAVGGEGYLLFSYKHDTGSRTYMGTSIDSLAGGQDTAGHWSNRTVKKLVLGGDESGKAFNGAGFTIEEVAIFVGSYLSNEDVADYVFPTLNIDDTATMTMTALNEKVAAFGENAFNYFSASPVVTLDVAPSDATKAYLRSALWNGTVFIKDQDIANLDPTVYGNKNSTLKLSGVSGHWGGAVYANTATPAIELEDSETEGREYGYYASNGYSFYSQGAYYYVHTPELKGSGTYKTNTSGNGALFVADKFDNFTGKLDLAGKTVWLGTGAPTHSQDTWNNQVNFPGTVRLGGSTIPANYSTWTVPNGYKGTLRLTTAVSEQYQVSFLTSSAWKGTCQLAWSAGNSAFDIVNYGNANSVIEVATNFGAYPTQNGGSDGAEVAAEVKIAENVTWTVSNGWTSESYRTTFAKLSGAGNLTVNGGSGGVGDPIPYTITRLEGFTGTIAGTRGKFTIGTIVAATEPTPGTKLVNITTSNAPVLDSTTVVYNNATQDVELEFKAGDGIYVKELPNVACIVVDEETTNYYKALTGEGGAIANTMNFSRVIELLADVNEAYELDPEAARPLKVKLNGFTWTGVSAPDGYKVSTTYVEATGVTQYSCVVDVPDKARIGETGYPTVNGALEAVLQYNMAVGTVVEVLDSEYKRSDTSALLQQYFTWDSSARTWTRKATTNGEGTQTVTAATAQAACAAVTVLPTSSEVQDALGGYPYETYFQKTAEDNGDGTWTVTVELKKSQIFEGDASETTTVTATLNGVLDGEATKITIPAKRGLYYSFKSGDEVTGMTEGKRKLATGTSVELDKVGGDTFYQVLVNTADNQ